MGSSRVGLVYDKRMCAHANWSYHPERPERITAIWESLKSAGIVDRCERVEARDATIAELASVHTEEHIARMCAVSSTKYDEDERAAMASEYNSIYFNEGSSKSALLAAGSVVEVCRRVAQGDLRAGAAIVRPPGHHAESGAAMGFCLFNNVAVAAHVLVHGNLALGVRKVLIVDWDVHHGNGTQHMFWKDPQVLYFSIHRHDFGHFYPGGDEGDCDKVGEDGGTGFNVNVPWPHEGFGDLDYLAVFDQLLIPIAREFEPDLVLVSGGFDSASGDPLGGCEVTPAGYSQMIHRLMSLANGRVVLALEGGYNLKSISKSYLACMKILLGERPEKVTSRRHHLLSTIQLIEEVRSKIKQHWLALSTEDECLNMNNHKVPLAAEDLNGDLAVEIQEVLQVPEIGFTERESLKILPVDVNGLTAGAQADANNLLVENFKNALNLNKDDKTIAQGCSDTGGSHERHSSYSEARTKCADDCHVAQKDVDQKGKSIPECRQDIGLGDVEGASIAQPYVTQMGAEACQTVNTGDLDVGKTDVTEDNSSRIHGIQSIEVGSEECRDTQGRTLVEEHGLQDGGVCQDGTLLRGCGFTNSLTPNLAESSTSCENPESFYVWYACYASNMWTARFMCYIEGGQVEGMAKRCTGARNKSAPVASRWLEVPCSLFFGHSWTDMWGAGGVAFLDPVSHGGATAHLRLYKITLEQLSDVLTQESGGDPSISPVSIQQDHVNRLRDVQAAESHSTLNLFEDAWYGTIKYLGDLDGLPILTITCSVTEMQKFREGHLPMCPPSQPYLMAILRGLSEHDHLSEEESKAYINSKFDHVV